MRRNRRFGTFVGLTLLLPALHAPAAAAGPIEDKRAEAARVSSQIDAQAARIVALDRRYRRAQEGLGQTENALAGAERELDSADYRFDAARGRITRNAVDAYVHSGRVGVIEQLASSDGRDLAARAQYLRVATGQDRGAMDELKSAREDLRARRGWLQETRNQVRATGDRLRADRQAVLGAQRVQAGTLSRLKGELGALVAAEQARRDAEAARRDAEAARRAAENAKRGAAARGGPTGGPWACIRELESGNNYRSPGGGAYQFTDDTWHGLGHSGTAGDAPPEEQDAAAVQLQQRAGWGPWTTAAACGRA